MTEPVPADLVARTWSRPLELEPPGSIPESAEVVILGGGIIGVSTAWFLARQGGRVALCEKGHIAGEQSGRNWDWIRQQGRDAREMPMILESLNIWRGPAEAIGEDVGFAQTGCLYAARTDEELEGHASWLPTAREYGSSVACACRSAQSSSMLGERRGAGDSMRPSPFEKTRVPNPQPRARAAAGIRSILAEQFP
ncbi:MAG: FAD-binding oxidoreductase [Gammaproteobacteria bacterium]|nr:FAD-binding oxidoreductase [Gammaproteobacteria bacterium]